MRILLVVANFVPEIGIASHLYHDIALGLIEKGHEISVLTSYPRNYNLDEQNRFREYPFDEVIDGIHIHRVKTAVKRDSMIRRGLEHNSIPQKYFRRVERLNEKFDVALIYIPPLPLYKFGLKLKACGIPSVLHIEDFHPQELTDVGVLKNPLLIELMRKEERRAYSTANSIIVPTKGGVEYVVQRGANRDAISVIYNSYNGRNHKNNEYLKIKQVGTKEKYNVTYAGIISPFQGLDRILDAAKLLDKEKFRVTIVGDGMSKSHLMMRRDSEKISNVAFLPYQDRRKYFEIISNSDVNLVTLDERMKAPCLPGKISELIRAEKPIVFSIPRESETNVIAEDLGIGVITSNDDPNELAESIIKTCLDFDLRNRFIDNQKKAYDTGPFNPKINLLMLERILETMASQNEREKSSNTPKVH